MRGGAAPAARARKSAMTPEIEVSQRSRAARLLARPPHPAPPKLALLAKATQPSPARGEGYFLKFLKERQTPAAFARWIASVTMRLSRSRYLMPSLAAASAKSSTLAISGLGLASRK